MQGMRARIRDFVVTEQDWIFSVVSYDLGDEELNCLLRYVPDEKGERVSERGRYRKLDFYGAYEFLREHQPEYVKDVHAIPKERIGITGSFLCGLNGANSDLDFVVYGRANFDRAITLVKAATEAGVLTGLKEDLWQQIYRKRKPELSYEEFVAHELRKGHRGAIGGTYFDILYVRDPKELQQLDRRNSEPGERAGYKTITAEVTDASFSFDSPAIYKIKHPEVNKVLSFTHTYTGQALAGETIEARGVLERTKHETRLVVGTTREARDEWIRSRSLSFKGRTNE
jgi:predicted nucleotidyltransferase